MGTRVGDVSTHGGVPFPNDVPQTVRNSRYRPGVWRYNIRVACVLLPALLMLVFSGGSVLVGVALTGFMTTYVFDLLGAPEAALGTVWLTVVCLCLGTVMGGDVFVHQNRGSFTSCFLLLTHGQLLFTVGVWATVQFRWIQQSFPGVVFGCERVLIAVCPLLLGSCVGGFAGVEIFGAKQAPFCLCFSQAIGFKYFALPLKSSFIAVPGRSKGPRKDDDNALKGHNGGALKETALSGGQKPAFLILSDEDVVAHALCFLLAPALTFLVSRRNVFKSLQASGLGLVFENTCDLFILGSFPLLFMCAHVRSGGLRWVSKGILPSDVHQQSRESRDTNERGEHDFGFPEKSPSVSYNETADQIKKRQRRLVITAATGLATTGFASGVLGKVLCSGFDEYVKLPSPYGYASVFFCAYGFLLFAVSFVTRGEPFAVTAGTLAIAIVSGVAAIGSPVWCWPFAGISAVGFLRFVSVEGFGNSASTLQTPSKKETASKRYFGTESKTSAYWCFVVGAVLVSYKFVDDNFGKLDVTLDGLPMRDLTRFLLVNVSACLLAPGVALLSFANTSDSQKSGNSGNTSQKVKVTPKAFGALLCLHSLMFARTEHVLHMSRHDDGTSMYPPYLVVITTVLGFKCVRALARKNAITEITSWFAKCVYVAKAFTLVVPGEDVLGPLVLLALAASSYSVGGGGDAVGVTGGNTPGGNTEHEDSRYASDRGSIPAEDAARVFLIAGACLHARFVFFDAFFMLSGHRPSDATLFGGLLVLVASGCIPLVSARYVHSVVIKRLLLGSFALGVILVTLKPRMPWHGENDGFWYDEMHVPDFEPDETDVYGDRAVGGGNQSTDFGNAKEWWATWALVFAALAGLYCGTTKGAGALTVGNGSAGIGVGVGGVHITLRTVFATSGGFLFGAYLGSETFPGANGSGLILPLRLACASFAWFLNHVVSPETASRVAGRAAWGSACASAVFLLAAFWSQTGDGYDVQGHFDESNTAGSSNEQSEVTDERLRREDARDGVLGVVVVFAAQAAFVLKLAAGKKRGLGDGRPARYLAAGEMKQKLRARRGSSGSSSDEYEDEDVADGSSGGNTAALDANSRRRRRAPDDAQTQKTSPFAPFCGRRPEHMRASANALARRAMRRNRTDWVPALGNTVVCAAFVFGTALSHKTASDPVAAVFAVAPITLMLHYDGVFLNGVGGGGARRYSAGLAVVASQLFVMSLAHALGANQGDSSLLYVSAKDAWGGGENSGGRTWRLVVTDVLLALAPVPCAWRCVAYLWSPTRRVGFNETAITVPLNALVLVASSCRPAMALAVTSAAVAAAQHLAQRNARREGMKAL